MIQANELRIGNYVSHFNNIGVVETIEKNVVQYLVYGKLLHNGNFGNVIEAISPIPLTPEILEKCGFVMLHHLGRVQPTLRVDAEMELHVTFDGNRPICILTISQDNTDENIDLATFSVERLLPVQSLHQLQNLYFALTGEELEVKL